VFEELPLGVMFDTNVNPSNRGFVMIYIFRNTATERDLLDLSEVEFTEEEELPIPYRTGRLQPSSRVDSWTDEVPVVLDSSEHDEDALVERVK
jgi:hypothetical protein